MTKRDYYEVLGVSRTCSSVEIKTAYRSMAKKCHPDLHPGDEQAEIQFKEITEAYEVLSNPDKRVAYDQYGHSAFEQGSGFGGFGGANPFGNMGGGFSDLFEEVFNGFMGGGERGFSRSGQKKTGIRGDDLRYDLTISLKEAFTGVKKQVQVNSYVICEACCGKGGEDLETCSVCHGSGRIHRQSGFFMVETPCSACSGTGQVITKPCKSCKGSGRIKQKMTLEVSIPAGVDSGVRMRVAGKGEAGQNGGEAGDLYVFITVEEGKFFKREGQDLFCEVPISFTMAVLGGSIQIPTIDGNDEKEKIKIPEGTQSGTQIRIKGRGFPALRGASRGDLYIKLNVETPVNLTSSQKELLSQFEAEHTGKSIPKTTLFWENIKKIFTD